MIAAYDVECRVWVAAGNGPLRPIVAEAGTREDAVKAYAEQYAEQVGEEYVYAAVMSARADMSNPDNEVQDLG